MQSKKKPAVEKKPPPVYIRIRFRPEEVELIRVAAANRGMGLNTFVRLVTAGTAKLIIDSKTPPEELIGKFLSPEEVLMRGRQPAQSDRALE